MKKTLKFLSSALLISTLGLVNCHKYETGGSAANGYIVGQYINGLIQSATTGNCAISVNLGSLYAGAIVQGAAASSTNFLASNYEASTGSTMRAQGYTEASDASVTTAINNSGASTPAMITAVTEAAHRMKANPTKITRDTIVLEAISAYGSATNPTVTAITSAVDSIRTSANASNTAAVAVADASTAVAAANSASTAITTCVTAGTALAVCQGAAVTAAATVNTAYRAAYTTEASQASITALSTIRATAIATAEAAVGGASTNVTAAATTVADAAIAAANIFYGRVALNQVYANVPYNKKYDAFLTDGGAWTATTRATAIAAQKASTDLAALAGSLFVPYMTALGQGVSDTNARAAAQANMNTFYTSYSPAEKTAMAQALGSTNTSATLDTLVSNATSTTATLNQMFNAGSANNATAGTGTFGSILCSAGGGTSGAAILLNTFTCASGLNTNFGTIVAGTAGLFTNSGGFFAVANAYLARLSYARGSAIMACARIPKANCTVNSLLTQNREGDIASLVTSYKQIAENGACRQPSQALMQRVLTNGTTGLPFNTSVQINSNYTYTNTAAQGGSEGSTTGLAGNAILASKAYPKSGALLGISSTFASAHPMKEGTTAYDTTTFYGGSNLNVANVTSCEAIGLGNVGPTPIQATDSIATTNTKRKLSDVKEIVYAFSAYNVAATAYAVAAAATTAGTQGTLDAVACNRQFRRATVIPATLGVGTSLNPIDAVFGDGGATSLITACVYGGDGATRTAVSALLGSTLPGVASCPATASTGASSFGATGLTTYTSFPDGQ